jgi:hypothetical protein
MTKLDPKIKATVIHAVLSEQSLRPECELLSFEGKNGKKRYQAVALSKEDANVACVFSLPTNGRNIYVTVSDGDRGVLRRVLATLEDMEAESPVLLGNVLLLDSSELRERDIVGLILLPPNTSNVLSHLPLDITVGNIQYRFSLIVFLSKTEHEVWKAKGHDALMDLFANTDKDLVGFGAPVPSG